MPDYFNSLRPIDFERIEFIIKYCISRGITNKYSQAAILSVASKEGGFEPVSEKSYAKTNNARIRKVFGLRLSKYTEDQLTALKKDPMQFFEAVYGSSTVVGRKNGNTLPGYGYKYRGRGPNQITFFNTYKKIGAQIGVDMVNNPDLLNNFDIGMKAMIQYFINCFATAPSSIKAYYNTTSINDFTKLSDAVKAFYHANAGFGKEISKVEEDQTGGRKKALDRSEGFYKIVLNHKP